VSAREAWCRELLDTLHKKPAVERESNEDEQKQREVEAQQAAEREYNHRKRLLQMKNL
jgi:hypothetical protein